MGFISFVGRVLFASLFLLSAYQEYVPRSTLSSLTPQIPSRLSSIDSAARRQIEAAPLRWSLPSRSAPGVPGSAGFNRNAVYAVRGYELRSGLCGVGASLDLAAVDPRVS